MSSRIDQARFAAELGTQLLGELNEEVIKDRGPFFVIGQLEETLRSAVSALGELLAELPPEVIS